MNWELVKPFLEAGLSLFVLGVVLYIPAHFWVKRKLRKEPELAKQRVTKPGFIVYGAMVAALMLGLGVKHMEGIPGPNAIVGLIVVGIFAPVAGILHAFGIKLVEKIKTKDV